MNSSKENRHSTHSSSALADSVEGVIQAGSARLSDAAGAVTHKYEQLSTGIQDTFCDARDQALRVKKSVERTVAARPLTSLLVVGGLAFLIGALYRRRG